MPIQAPQWTEFLQCPICCNEFAANQRPPISLGCGHTICRTCLATVHNKQCPFDQATITTDIENLPINYALLQLVSTNHNNNNGHQTASSIAAESEAATNNSQIVQKLSPEDLECYKLAKRCIEYLALYLRHLSHGGCGGHLLSRPMQRKLVTLLNCQLVEEEGRSRALRAARSLGERTVTELILQHQNPQLMSSNLWAAVRARGCQFLGPAMQEEVLKLVLLALEDGSALSRKVLVMFVVQRLGPSYPQASKTSIGHVVQLLYRASCFKVSKREGNSSLMQLKEEFRTYEALRREHDAQIVQMATEAGLRIAPDQWSPLLYGDSFHKSHMQSIIDKLQTPESFSQSVQELVMALQRTGDPANLSELRGHLKLLASIDPNFENSIPSWQEVAKALDAAKQVVNGLVEFGQHHSNRKLQDTTQMNPKYKISLCRNLTLRRICPRGTSCTFAHSEEELEKYRAKNCKCAPKGSYSKDPNDYLDTPSHMQSDEASPMRYGNSQKQLSSPLHSQPPNIQQAPPTINSHHYGELLAPPHPGMHAASPIPGSGPMVARHRFDPPYGMNFPPTLPLQNVRNQNMAMRSPRPGPLHGNFPNGPPSSPQQHHQQTLNSQQQMFHPTQPSHNNFGPADMYGMGMGPPIAPSTQQPTPTTSHLIQSGNPHFFPNSSNDYSKMSDMMRQSNLWDQQRPLHGPHPPPPQSQHQNSLMAMNIKNPPIGPQYMNNNNANNFGSNSDSAQSAAARQRRLEFAKGPEMPLNQISKNPPLNGNYYKNHPPPMGLNNNNNGNMNSKEDFLATYWNNYALDVNVSGGQSVRENREAFARSDSILDDEYVPFEAPTSSSKYGPISRLPKSNQASQPNSAFNSPSSWPHGDLEIPEGMRTSDQKYKYGPNNNSSHGTMSMNIGNKFDFGLSNLQLIANKEKDLVDKLTPLSLWNTNPASMPSKRIFYWNDSGKESTAPKSDVREDTYEADIAKDMHELEKRLVSELSDEDKMWSHADDSGISNT